MLFSVNRETSEAIIVIRDLPSLIAVNCAHDPPYGPSTVITPFMFLINPPSGNVKIQKMIAKHIFECLKKGKGKTAKLH